MIVKCDFGPNVVMFMILIEELNGKDMFKKAENMM